VNRRNVLSVLMQCFALTALLSIVWLIAGYSLAVGKPGGLTGGLDALFHQSVGPDKILGSAFQMTFFLITPALIVGTFVERINSPRCWSSRCSGPCWSMRRSAM